MIGSGTSTVTHLPVQHLAMHAPRKASATSVAGQPRRKAFAYDCFKNWFHAYRLVGFCYVGGLSAGRPESLHLDSSWYVLYTCANVFICACTFAEAVLDSSSRRTLEAKTHIAFSIIYMIQCSVNLYVLLSGSSDVMRLLRLCASFESRRPSPPVFLKRMRRLFAGLLAYCAIFIPLQSTNRIYALVTATTPLLAFVRLVVLVGAFLFLFLATISMSTILFVSYLLSGYFSAIIKNARLRGAYTSSSQLQVLGFFCWFAAVLRLLSVGRDDVSPRRRFVHVEFWIQ